MSGLHGKVFLCAGAGSGIGAATATRLASQGARVAVGDVSLSNAESVVAQILQNGGLAVAVEYDQAEEESITALVGQTVAHFGSLNGLHGNAADLSPATLGADGHVGKMSSAVWMRTLQVNLVGNALLVRECIPHLVDAGGGSIVLTSSAVSSAAEPTRPAYAASKAGINALIRHIAVKWGKQGVRANAVSPGLVLSASAQDMLEDWFVDQSLAQSHSPRLGDPDDVAATVAFLLSEDSAWVTGQVWGVDGGLVLRD